MVKKRVYHGIGFVLMDPLPLGSRGRAGSGLKISPVHCLQCTCHRGRQGNQDDNVREYGQVNTV